MSITKLQILNISLRKKINSFFFAILLTLGASCMGSESIKSTHEEPTTISPGAWQTEAYFPLLKNKTIALVGNHSSTITHVHLADSLLSAGIELIKVFSPEHGFRGNAAAGEHVQSGIDEKTGLKVISLYGANRRPKPEDLHDIDLILFDIQDVGTRFYTYISTMSYVMEEAARQNIPMIILDRPNPNGHYIDGPFLDKKHQSFVGLHPIPVVHGMTVGEYAQMVNGENWLGEKLKCDLTVIAVKNYSREMWYELPFAPSPNLPNMNSILLYPSLCFFEGTVISLGRGTDFPFQVFGHSEFPSELFDFTFTPQSRPEAPKPPQMDRLCFGKDLRTTQPKELFTKNYIDIQLIIDAYNHFPHKESFFNNFFEKLAGTDLLRKQIQEGASANEIRTSWEKDLLDFRKMRIPYLIYPDLQ